MLLLSSGKLLGRDAVKQFAGELIRFLFKPAN
jgi:hypothetical protein